MKRLLVCTALMAFAALSSVAQEPAPASQTSEFCFPHC